MKSARFLVPMLLSAGCAFASTMRTYTSQSAFLYDICCGYYQETFSTSTTGSSLSYSGNGYAYRISDSSGLLQTTYGWLQDTLTSHVITITFTSGKVTAIGGDFFAVSLLAQPAGTTVTLNLSDGSTQTIASGASATSFTGYAFDRPITSMTISAATTVFAPRWAALDNLTVGTVPEPGTWMLLAAGAGVLALLRLRRRSPTQ